MSLALQGHITDHMTPSERLDFLTTPGLDPDNLVHIPGIDGRGFLIPREVAERGRYGHDRVGPMAQQKIYDDEPVGEPELYVFEDQRAASGGPVTKVDWVGDTGEVAAVYLDGVRADKDVLARQLYTEPRALSDDVVSAAGSVAEFLRDPIGPVYDKLTDPNGRFQGLNRGIQETLGHPFVHPSVRDRAYALAEGADRRGLRIDP